MLEIVNNLSFSPPALQALPQTSTIQVQVLNRMTGSCDEPPQEPRCKESSDLRVVTRSRHSLKPVGQADRAKPSEIKPDGPRASRLTFVEDFTLEHSLPGVHITSIEISGIF